MRLLASLAIAVGVVVAGWLALCAAFLLIFLIFAIMANFF